MADNNVAIKQVSVGVTHEIHNVQVGTDGSIPIVDQVVQVSVLPAFPAGSNAIGSVTVSNFPGTVAATQSGTWNIGLSAGANAIGSVSVSNFPATQPVSGSVTAVQATGSNLHVVVDTAPTTAVTGTFWQATQPISASALPLPSGASTAAKQPAIGTAGTASTDVITIQGITSMTPLQVAGTVTAANASVSATGSAVPASATMTGGTDGTNLRAILTDTTGRQVVNVNGSVAVTGTFFQATQPVSGTMTVTQATGTNLHVVVDSAPSTAVTGIVTAIYVDTAPSTINITAADVASSTATGANSQSIITGTPTANSAASFTISAQDTVNVQVSGTWVGTIQSEVSMDGGTTWYLRGVHQNGTNYVQAAFTGNLGGSLSVAGSTNFRMRCTAYTSGTATVRVSESINPGVVYLANSPQIADGTIPSQKLAIDASGRITANIGTSSLALDTTLTGGTQKTQIVSSGGNVAAIDSSGNQQIRGGFTEFTGLTASALNADLLASTDVSAYKWISIQVLTQATGGTTSWQGSNDNSTWTSVMLNLVGSQTASGQAISTTTTGIYHGAISFRYFRLRETAYTSGTATGVVELYTSPGAYNIVGAAANQMGTWTVQQGSTPSATPWAFNPVAAATGGYSFTHISTNATTTAKSGAGYLRSIIINTPGAVDTITVYDNTSASGTVIAIINDASASANALVYDIAFSTGLTLVTAGTTAPDITVTWK